MQDYSRRNTIAIYHTKHEANTWLRSVGPGHNGSIGAVDKPLRRHSCLQRKGAIQASSAGPQRQPANRNLLLSLLPGDRLQDGGKDPRSTAPATLLLPLRSSDGTQQPAQLFRGNPRRGLLNLHERSDIRLSEDKAGPNSQPDPGRYRARRMAIRRSGNSHSLILLPMPLQLLVLLFVIPEADLLLSCPASLQNSNPKMLSSPIP